MNSEHLKTNMWPTPPPPTSTHVYIQTDGDYIKHVVMALRDHMLKNTI